MSKTVWKLEENFLYKNGSKYFTYDSNEQLADCLLEELNDLEDDYETLKEVNDSLESDIYDLERENSRLEERLSEVEDELEVLNGLTHDT